MADRSAISRSTIRHQVTGPLRADDLRPGTPHELNNGHLVHRAPSGAGDARSNLVGAAVLSTDPMVTEAGIDAGYSPRPEVLRAPDVAIGNVPDRGGWIRGAPHLAVQYVDSGQDEEDLQDKIQDFLSAGTKAVWVVRLVSPRRVEVHEPDKPMRVLGSGDMLSAPSILQNNYPVDALYDRRIADELTLRNLLQRRGYQSLDEVRAEGRKQRELAAALLSVLAARGIPVPEAEKTLILASRDSARLDAWLRRALSANTLADVLQVAE